MEVKINKLDKKIEVNKVEKKVGIIKYIIALLILGIAIIILTLSITSYNKQKKEADMQQNRYEVYNDFYMLSVEFKNTVEDLYGANENYNNNKINNETYIEMLAMKPKALNSLLECEEKLRNLYTVYNRIKAYKEDLNLCGIITNDKIDCYKPIVEACHNTLYGCIVNYNTTIDGYNTWTIDKIGNPLYDDFFKKLGVEVMDKFTSSVCSDWIDLDEDGIFKGKVD